MTKRLQQTYFDLRVTQYITLFCLFPQVKGYRYLEEDNSDESDSEKSEEDGDEEEEEEHQDHVVEEMGADDGEEEEQGDKALGIDSPRARWRGAEGHRRRRDDAHVVGEWEEREGG